MTDPTLIERIADSIQLHANAKQVYGEPVERDGTTIIPVARVQWGFGGGGGGRGASHADGLHRAAQRRIALSAHRRSHVDRFARRNRNRRPHRRSVASTVAVVTPHPPLARGEGSRVPSPACGRGWREAPGEGRSTSATRGQ